MCLKPKYIFFNVEAHSEDLICSFLRCHVNLSNVISQKWGLNVNSAFSFDRLHEQLNESDDAAQCYMLYIQDIFSCGVSILKYKTPLSTNVCVVLVMV